MINIGKTFRTNVKRVRGVCVVCAREPHTKPNSTFSVLYPAKSALTIQRDRTPNFKIALGPALPPGPDRKDFLLAECLSRIPTCALPSGCFHFCLPQKLRPCVFSSAMTRGCCHRLYYEALSIGVGHRRLSMPRCNIRPIISLTLKERFPFWTIINQRSNQA